MIRTRRVLALADTHASAVTAPRVIERLRPQLERADLIVHAGDVTDACLLDELAQFADVRAVLGNNDVGLSLPERTTVEVLGTRIALVHDSGQAERRGRRLRRWFPDADVVVFGHSHLPWHTVDIGDDGHVQHHLNPGSPTQRRRAPSTTVAWITVSDRKLAIAHELVGVSSPAEGSGTRRR